MLPKDKRLNLKKDFNWVSQGSKVITDDFKLMYRDGSNNKPLVGISISSKVFKKATLRSKVKRITADSIQVVYPGLRKNINLVIMPKVTIFSKSIENIIKQLKDVKGIYNTY